MHTRELPVTVLITGTVSSGFEVPLWGMFYGALFPTMDNGDIGLEISRDDGSNYHPVIDPATGIDAVLCKNGSDPGWVDFSDWIRFMPEGSPYKARFTCAAQASGEVTIYVMIRG